MALRGNLKDFSLPDVFQLITFSQKTGVLRINREDGAFGSVWFRDGEVFFASSNWHKEPLGERLVKAQRITPQALSRALDIRSAEAAEGRRLGQILIDEGYITDSVLEDFVAEQIQDTIFDLMRWDEGDFDFEAMPEVVDEDIGLSVSIENIVMEGARRLEEWNRIRKKIPSMDVVFKMATAPGEGTFEISLKPTEWQLLLLTDATRSVADLAHETERTDFEVARIVYGLFSAGLLEFATDEEIERNRAERAEREEKAARLAAERRAAEEAREAAAQEAAARETAAREAQQAEETARLKAEEAAAAKQARPPAAPAAPAVPAAAPTDEAPQEPTEVPEFLGGAAPGPSAEDESVLEQAMDALLEHRPATGPSVAPAEPVEPAKPHVPAEEPAFISAEPAEQPETGLMPVPSVEDLLGIQPVSEPSEAPAVQAPETAEAPVRIVEPLPEFQAEPEAALEAEPEAAEAPPALDIDFERDLMALGLGELPSDLLQPLTAPETAAAEVPQAPAEEPQTPAGEMETLEQVAEPMSEIGLGAGLGVEELGRLVEDLGHVEEMPQELPGESLEELPEEAPAEPDFSELLQSLDIDAVEESAAQQDLAEGGFDVGILEDTESAPSAGGGVISTDAFIEDISIEHLGLTGGMTDELSALTGAERRPSGRPQANVHAIPDEGSPVLKRDARVDADTLRKIIEGIKNL